MDDHDGGNNDAGETNMTMLAPRTKIKTKLASLLRADGNDIWNISGGYGSIQRSGPVA